MTDTGTNAIGFRRLPGWARRHRVLAVGLAITMLATVGFIGFLVTRPGPEGLVRDYLDVLRSKDADAAREYASGLDDIDTANDALLVDAAMSADWDVTQLVTRHDDGDSAMVDVTITAADKTVRKGRFELDDDGPDGWRIRNPLVKIDLANLPMRYAEFNGEAIDARSLNGSDVTVDQSARKETFVWLFPGAYVPYGGSVGRLELSGETFVAAPSGPINDETVAEDFLPEISLGQDLAADADAEAQFADWIDECAKSTAINPPGCPFAGGFNGEPGQVSLYNGDSYRTGEVKWKVKTYPKVQLIQGQGLFVVQEVEPGKVTISGTGTEKYDSDGSKRDFKGDCDIDLAQATAELVEPEVFAFAPGVHSENTLNETCGLRYN